MNNHSWIYNRIQEIKPGMSSVTTWHIIYEMIRNVEEFNFMYADESSQKQIIKQAFMRYFKSAKYK